MNSSSDRAQSSIAAPTPLADAAYGVTPAALNALYEQAGEALMKEHWAPFEHLFVLEGTLGALGEARASNTHYNVALTDGSGPPTLLNIRAGLLRDCGEGSPVRVTGRVRTNMYKLAIHFRLEVLELEPLGRVGRARQRHGVSDDDLRDLRRFRHPFPFGRKQIRVIAICGRDNAVLADFEGQLGPLVGALVDLVAIEVPITDPVAVVSAIERADGDVLALIRGGGDGPDMSVFSTLPVLQAMAAKPCFRLIGIGHTQDTHLLDGVVDFAASTPTAAGRYVRDQLDQQRKFMAHQRHETQRRADEQTRQALEPHRHALHAAELQLRETRSALEHVKGLTTQRLEGPSADQAHIQHLITANHDLRWQRAMLAGLAVLLVVALTTSVVGWAAATRTRAASSGQPAIVVPPPAAAPLAPTAHSPGAGQRATHRKEPGGG